MGENTRRGESLLELEATVALTVKSHNKLAGPPFAESRHSTRHLEVCSGATSYCCHAASSQHDHLLTFLLEDDDKSDV